MAVKSVDVMQLNTTNNINAISFIISSGMSAITTLAYDISGAYIYVGRYSGTVHSIYRVDVNAKTFITWSGTASTTGRNDGLITAALYNNPRGLIMDSQNNLYVGEYTNNAVRIINIGTSTVSTLAGSGSATVSNGIGKLAGLPSVASVAVTSGGSELFVMLVGYIKQIGCSTGYNFTYGTCTSIPTAFPLGGPTSSPSRQPSSEPSRQPLGKPSSQPSLQPSSLPSGQPTHQPTSKPTSQPILKPSCQPTLQPSSQPSAQPVSKPTRVPSEQPSRQPSRQPTSLPTQQPSSQPTIQPSPKPSQQPSTQPSSKPSTQPYTRPSNQPSSKPSMQPFNRPTSQPYSKPSTQPILLHNLHHNH